MEVWRDEANLPEVATFSCFSFSFSFWPSCLSHPVDFVPILLLVLLVVLLEVGVEVLLRSVPTTSSHSSGLMVVMLLSAMIVMIVKVVLVLEQLWEVFVLWLLLE